MHLNNKPTVLMPHEIMRELSKLPKAGWMDVAWDLAIRCAGEDNDPAILAELRKTIEIVLAHRKQAKESA